MYSHHGAYLLTIAVLISTALCTLDDFDSQVKNILKSELLTKEELANFSCVFQDLQETLRTLWSGCEVLPLGSFVTGLISKSSDADCMVRVAGRDVTSDRQLILEAARLLKHQPSLYHEVTTKIDARRRMPLMKFQYAPTKRNCDVNFLGNNGLQNSLLMKYYLNIESKFLSLAAILKLWSKVHSLRSTKTLTNYSLNILIIFFLQQNNIMPPFRLLQRKTVNKLLNNDWEEHFMEIQYNSTSGVSLYQLLGGFFRYYRDFDFDKYVVSSFLGYAIPNKAFKDVSSLPEELYLYKSYIRKANSRPLLVDTKLCIQDVIIQSRNIGHVPESKANTLLANIRFAARIFDIIPKDTFLRVLLDNHYP